MKMHVIALVALLPLASFASAEKLRKKMSEIVIPVIEMENATVAEVFAYLNDQAKQWDLDGDGINLFVKASKERLASTVTISFRNIPLKDALDTICSGSKIYYKVEDHAVILADKTATTTTEVLETRMYSVKGSFGEMLKRK